jgi:hypothetical protein
VPTQIGRGAAKLPKPQPKQLKPRVKILNCRQIAGIVVIQSVKEKLIQLISRLALPYSIVLIPAYLFSLAPSLFSGVKLDLKLREIGPAWV